MDKESLWETESHEQSRTTKNDIDERWQEYGKEQTRTKKASQWLPCCNLLTVIRLLTVGISAVLDSRRWAKSDDSECPYPWSHVAWLHDARERDESQPWTQIFLTLAFMFSSRGILRYFLTSIRVLWKELTESIDLRFPSPKHGPKWNHICGSTNFLSNASSKSLLAVGIISVLKYRNSSKNAKDNQPGLGVMTQSLISWP